MPNSIRFICWLAVASVVVLLLRGLWPASEVTHHKRPGAIAVPNMTTQIEPSPTTHRKSTSASKVSERIPHSLTDGDIKELGAQLRDGKNEHAKHQAFKKLMAGMTSENAAKIQDQIEHLSPHSQESRLFYNTWGRLGGEPVMAIAAWASKQSAEAALAGWAIAEPAAARSYFDSLQQHGHDLSAFLCNIQNQRAISSAIQ